MAYLMFIGFDNSSRLFRNVWYLEYRKVRFKLFQNNCRKWCDNLVTKLPSMGDLQAKEHAYAMASEFLCAVCWQNSSRIIMQNLGGRGYSDKGSLRSAKCTIRSFPVIAFPGHMVGYDISVLPHIQTDQQRTALLLYRDALGSNNNHLSFLFYWQILETNGSDPVGWVNKTVRKLPPQLGLDADDIAALSLGGRPLGNYLQDDCRHAIAHINRKPGRRTILLDSAADAKRIWASTNVVKALAEYYIKHNLMLNKRLHLVRRHGSGFPTYADEAELRTYICKLAYQRPTTVMTGKH